MSFCGTNQTEPISLAFQGAKWRQFTLILQVVLLSFVKGSSTWGITFWLSELVQTLEMISYLSQMTKTTPFLTKNVSSTVPNTGAGVGDNISVPKGSENIAMNSSAEGSEPPIPKDSSLETDEKPIIFPKLESTCQESSDEPPKIEKVPEEIPEGMIEEILPIPPEYRFPDGEGGRDILCGPGVFRQRSPSSPKSQSRSASCKEPKRSI